MGSSENIQPPNHLSGESKALWAKIVDEYVIDTAAAQILETFFDARERRAHARSIIAEVGPFYTDRFGGVKQHPAVAIERDTTLIMHRSFRLLGCDQQSSGTEQQSLFR